MRSGNILLHHNQQLANEKACHKSWIEIQAGFSPECHADIEETVPLAVNVFTRVGGRLQGQEHVVLVGISEHRQV